MRVIAFLGLVVVLSGCSTFPKARQADELSAKLAQMTQERDDLSAQMTMRDEELARLYAERQRLAQERQQVVERVDELAEAKERLARDLQKQIGDYKAKLERTEGGLVITFLSEILFDSGQSVIRTDGYEVLDKVAEVLATTVKENRVAIEGHTDNEPIRYSGWKSNWELSAGRALAVLHYFTEMRGLPPNRFQIVGFGEFQPVASNETAQGRQQNRRVEIVIFPKALTKPKR